MGTQNPNPGYGEQAVAMANLEDNGVDGPTTLVEPVSQPDEDYCGHALYEGSETMLDWATLEDAEVIDITSGRELSNQELRARLGLEEA